ncbi:MAG TPA: hypothetical protein VF941_13430 [Clostridia bacterium]
MSMSSIMFGIIFGAIGMAYFGYGRKNANLNFLISGIILIVYPYFMGSAAAALVFIVGVILCFCPFIISRIF